MKANKLIKRLNFDPDATVFIDLGDGGPYLQVSGSIHYDQGPGDKPVFILYAPPNAVAEHWRSIVFNKLKEPLEKAITYMQQLIKDIK